jgi:ATP-dependent helicase/nuclease subunit B
MKTFTDRIAELIMRNSERIPHLTVVVPSERMVTYTRRSLFRFDNQPKLSPNIVTVDRWMQQLVDEPAIDRTRLLFRLYEISRKDPVEGESGFDAFLNWGEILLSDFDEIDRYLINANQLFKNLRDVRELENWSFNREELSEGQKRFMAFWEKLGPYYIALTKDLEKDKQTTKGKIYRRVAENIDLVFRQDSEAHFVFAGFNALSVSEMSVMKQLYVMGRAEVLIDSDAFYVSDPHHEAGAFHRELLSFLQVKKLPHIADDLTSKSCDVSVIECAQYTGQAKVVGTLLAGMSTAELDETLLLLADEQLIVPMIQQLPKSIEKANITLGLPLRGTSLRLWVDMIFRIQEAFERRGGKSVYHKDVTQFLHHPFIQGVMSREEAEASATLEKEMVTRNRLFVSRDSLSVSPRLTELMETILSPWNGDWLKGVRSFRDSAILLDELLHERYEMEKAFLRSFGAAVTGMINLFSEGVPEMQIRTFRNLFNQHWSTESMAYFGNPLDGLQIMGLLETRGLDFKRVIMLGLNEGKMPSTNPLQTLIPMDLRRFFGLPTPREKQGLFAHHFYRLFHCAETVHITYSAGQDGMGLGEPSRFIQQLELELAAVNPEFKMHRLYYELGNEEDTSEHIVEKTPGIVARLDEMLRSGISYSAVNTFISCPLDFYYKYVLRIGEEAKVEEEMESNTLGSVIHAVLEKLFQPFSASSPDNAGRAVRALNADDLQQMKKDAPLVVDEKFRELYSDDATVYATGMNHVNFMIAREIVQKVLSREIAWMNENPQSSLFIEALEKEIAVEKTFTINGEPKPVRFKGILDRIDRVDGVTRVIDYKSGSVEPKNVLVNNSKKPTAEAVIDAAYGYEKTHTLQLLIYSWLFQNAYGKPLGQAGIFSFINVSSGPFMLAMHREEDRTEIPEVVETVLEQIFGDMYSDQPFRHNPDARFCMYCANRRD